MIPLSCWMLLYPSYFFAEKVLSWVDIKQIYGLLTAIQKYSQIWQIMNWHKEKQNKKRCLRHWWENIFAMLAPQFFVSLPFFKVVLMCCPHSIERRNNHGQVGHCVPKLCKVVRHLWKKCFYFFTFYFNFVTFNSDLENNLCPWGRYYSLELTYVLNIGQTIGILLVNKGISGLTSNTLLIPQQDLFYVSGIRWPLFLYLHHSLQS